MAKKTCDCCLKAKPDLETKEWGRALRLCGSCRKAGREKVTMRIEARERLAPMVGADAAPAAPTPTEPAPAPAAALTPAQEPQAAAPEKPAAKPKRPRRASPGEPKARKPSVSSTVKELCDAGKANEEIWPIIKERFSLPDEHKWYVAWYRRHHQRKAEKAARAAAAAKKEAAP